jgi:hypothetical protein
MSEDEIDELIYAAMTTQPGERFFQWLNNNYLMSPRLTLDPNAALVQTARASLVAEINNRYARYLEKKDGGIPGKQRVDGRRGKERGRQV